MLFRGIVNIAACILCAIHAHSQPTVTVPWPTPSATPVVITMGYGRVNSTGTRFNWYVAVLDDLARFTVALPAKGCVTRNTTTSTANLHGCVVATNFGYFDNGGGQGPYCMGEVVINSSIAHWDDDGAPMLAMTADRTSVIGALRSTDIHDMDVTFAASGFGILVLNGQVHPPGIAQARAAIKALRPKAEEVAPRTVAGLDARGRLVLAAIDGVEALNLGTTLTETAEIFGQGAEGFPYILQHAINFDGGGSTTMSTSPAWPLPAQIFNRPTNTDTGPISERPVTTIACILG